VIVSGIGRQIFSIAIWRDEARSTVAMTRALRNEGVKIRYTNGYGATPRRLLSRNHKN